MIDFHSHVLPKMDDGSRSVEESVRMLELNYKDGVDIMVATPHYYARNESPTEFLARREKSYNMLKPELCDKMPRLIVGAEVLFFPGIARAEDVANLTIGDTNLLLVEMPFSGWSQNMINDLRMLQSNLGVRVVLAHIERYMNIAKKQLFDELLDEDFLFQCNADAFSSFSTRRLALQLLKCDKLHFIGTDCHNMRSRKPNMNQAVRVIQKKTPRGFLGFFNDNAKKLLIG